MTITCFIRYEIDPFKRSLFRQYADAWARIIPRCGGHLVGYFLPFEGSNYEAWGLVAFPSLAEYEAFAARERFILREERRFTEVLEAAFQRVPTATTETQEP